MMRAFIPYLLTSCSAWARILSTLLSSLDDVEEVVSVVLHGLNDVKVGHIVELSTYEFASNLGEVKL